MLKKNRNTLGALCVIMCESIFGGRYLFTKSATNSVSAFTLLGWRFFVAFLLLTALVLTGVIKVDFKGKRIGSLLAIAFFHPVLYFTCETFGISMTSASESSTIIAAVPITTMIISALILKEKPTRVQVAGIAVTISGVAVTVLANGVEVSFSAAGYVILVCAITSFSLFSAFSKKTTQFTEMEKTFVMVCSGALVFGAAAFIDNAASGTVAQMLTLPFRDTGFLVSILYMGTGSSVLAFFLYNKGLALIGTTRASSFVGVSTVVAVILGVLILGEPFSMPKAVGVVLVLAGVYIANAQFALKKGSATFEKSLDAHSRK